MKVKENKPFTLDDLVHKDYEFKIAMVGGQIAILCEREGEYITTIWCDNVSRALIDAVDYINRNMYNYESQRE